MMNGLTTTSSSNVEGLDALFTTLGIGFGSVSLISTVVLLCCCVIGLVLIAFNVWMLVDVVKRTEAELPNKQMWMILLIVGLVIGFGGIVAIVYFLGPRKGLKS